MADEEHGSSSRRTRSQAAPGWTSVAELVLVNEIAAVEADSPAELSLYQKWKIITENCAAQDVSHSMSQCRRKWESLLEDYRKIENHESLRSKKTSFWSLQSEKRENLGLPRSFDEELFVAIGNIVNTTGYQPESEPEDDPEAMGEAETVKESGPAAVGGFAATSADALVYKHNKGSRRKRQRSTSQGKRSWRILAEETFSEEALQSREEEKPPTSVTEKSPAKSFIYETLPESPVDDEPREFPQDSVEAEEVREQKVASILRENAERINAIVAETAGYGCDGDIGGSKDGHYESNGLVRSRGDELIDRLRVLVKALDQLCNIAQECK